MEILKNPNFDFLGKTRYFVAASLVIILGGLLLMSRPAGVRYGVEFSGGTQLVVKFQQAPAVDRIRTAVVAPVTGRGHPDLRRSREEPGADPTRRDG